MLDGAKLQPSSLSWAQIGSTLEAARRIGDSSSALAAAGNNEPRPTDASFTGPATSAGCTAKADTAGQGSVAAARLQKLPADEMADSKQVRRLERVNAGIDECVCTAVEYGIKERLHFSASSSRHEQLRQRTGQGAVPQVAARHRPVLDRTAYHRPQRTAASVCRPRATTGKHRTVSTSRPQSTIAPATLAPTLSA